MDELNELIQLTDEMLNLAMSSEWEELVELEQKREPKLRHYFAPDRLDSLPPEAMQGIERIMEQNKKITHLCQGARVEVMGHLGMAKQAKRVKSAYGAA